MCSSVSFDVDAGANGSQIRGGRDCEAARSSRSNWSCLVGHPGYVDASEQSHPRGLLLMCWRIMAHVLLEFAVSSVWRFRCPTASPGDRLGLRGYTLLK